MAAYAMPNAYVYDTGSLGWSAITAWGAGATIAAGAWRRQSAAPTVGNERCFVAIVAGTTGGSEPTWVVTKGATTTDNSVTWMECTGRSGPNGALADANAWTASNTAAAGDVIKNVAADTLFICTTAGTSTSGAEPTWNKTAGVTTTDGTATWTSIGAASGYTGWQYPHSRLRNALASTWSVAGDSIYVSSTHVATQATALTLTGQGTAASPNKILSVDKSASPPTALLAGAQEKTTASSTLAVGNFFAYWYGVTFSSGSSSSLSSLTLASTAAASAYHVFDSCPMILGNTASTSIITFGAFGGANDLRLDFVNPTFTFGAVGQSIQLSSGRFNLKGGSAAASGSVPTSLITFVASRFAEMRARDMDLSTLTGNLLNVANANPSLVAFENSKLNASVTMTTGSVSGPGGPVLKLHNCDSGTKNYRFYENSYGGSVQQETTTINNAGATDGTTPVSWKAISSANASFTQPLELPVVFAWNDVTGSSKTATVEIAGSATLNNDDVWMEIEYPGNASYPIGSAASCAKSNILASHSSIPTSSATWGGSPAVTQHLQVTFTPQMKGPVKARIFVGKPSTTVYVDPLLTVA